MTSSNSGVDSQSLNGPNSMYSDGSKVYVSDSGNNNRIILFPHPISKSRFF